MQSSHISSQVNFGELLFFLLFQLKYNQFFSITVKVYDTYSKTILHHIVLTLPQFFVTSTFLAFMLYSTFFKYNEGIVLFAVPSQ